MFKPEGHSTVSPYLIVADAKAALAFIEAVFDAPPSLIVPRDNSGGIAHAEVKIDDTVVMLGEAPNGPESHVHVYLADPDAVLGKAKAAGGVVVQEMSEKGDGDRRGGVKDPTGTTWWLARAVDRR